jgi:multiple sugar transport system ATP-binding protein
VVHVVAIAVAGLTKIFDDGVVAVDDLTLTVGSGEFVVLLGPTGCGKSTLLRLVAGLDVPTRGHVTLDGEPVDDETPRHHRIAMVFPDYALYPHLSVAQNIGFPLRAGVHEPGEVAQRIAEAARHLGIGDLLNRLPAHLSGGQRQRVAMARAIVRRPEVLLLDEPLSNVDAGVRAELRGEITELARRLGVTTLYVTHDQSEAMTMADRVAVLRRGALQQIGSPEEVYADPHTVFVAAFIGTPRPGLLEAAIFVDDGAVVLDLGGQVLTLPADDPRTAALADRHTERVTVALRADALTVAPPEAPGVLLRGVVHRVENLGHEVIVHLDTGGLSTSGQASQLELPEPGRLPAPPAGEVPVPMRQRLARLIPHQRQESPPVTARTAYGFYPAYGGELPGEEQPAAGQVAVRMPVTGRPGVGDSLTLAVDLDKLLLFDRAGARIRVDEAVG